MENGPPIHVLIYLSGGQKTGNLFGIAYPKGFKDIKTRLMDKIVADVISLLIYNFMGENVQIMELLVLTGNRKFI